MRRERWLALPLVSLGALGLGCPSGQKKAAENTDATPQIAEPARETPPALAERPPPQYLEQGWDEAMRGKWYYTTQGSQLVPYAWFLAVENPSRGGLLRDDEYFEAIGFIPEAETYGGLNRDGLPIGFTREEDGDEVWLGLTCAACHTADIRYKGTRYRVDGGPAHANLSLFLGDLIEGLKLTAADDARFERFAVKVLSEGADDAAKQALRAELRAQAEAIPKPSEPDPGFGRQDAFGAILNQVTSYELGIAENFHAEDAPVSYPHLWLTPHLAWVQWNGLAENPIARNIGEVLGVYGHIDFTAEDEAERFASTVRLRHLYELEQWAAALKAPKWPAAFGAIDEAKAARGKALYEAEGRCSKCHPLAPYPMTDRAASEFGKEFVRVTMVPLEELGTDPKVVLNALQRTAKTGPLAPIFAGKEEVPALEILFLATKKIFEREAKALGLSQEEQLAYAGFRVPSQDPPNLKAYKARPLDGVWATAPYLHNGSVPNLRELLKAPGDRVATFHVGSREFDPENVGFVSEAGEGSYLFDTSRAGDSNAGHDYSGDLSDDERDDLLEFLKTL